MRCYAASKAISLINGRLVQCETFCNFAIVGWLPFCEDYIAPRCMSFDCLIYGNSAVLISVRDVATARAFRGVELQTPERDEI
jgi:hypothetical protein